MGPFQATTKRIESSRICNVQFWDTVLQECAKKGKSQRTSVVCAALYRQKKQLAKEVCAIVFTLSSSHHHIIIMFCFRLFLVLFGCTLASTSIQQLCLYLWILSSMATPCVLQTSSSSLSVKSWRRSRPHTTYTRSSSC